LAFRFSAHSSPWESTVPGRRTGRGSTDRWPHTTVRVARHLQVFQLPPRELHLQERHTLLNLAMRKAQLFLSTPLPLLQRVSPVQVQQSISLNLRLRPRPARCMDLLFMVMLSRHRRASHHNRRRDSRRSLRKVSLRHNHLRTSPSLKRRKHLRLHSTLTTPHRRRTRARPRRVHPQAHMLLLQQRQLVFRWFELKVSGPNPRNRATVSSAAMITNSSL